MIKKIKGKNLIILVLCAIFLFGFIRQERAIRRIQDTITQKHTELEKLKEKNKQLEEEVKSADSDEYIETLARERLNMVKTWEQVVNDKKGDSESQK